MVHRCFGSAYLESYTTKQIVFTAGPEFGELEGHTLKVVKALYGLRMSGKCWHDRLFDVLRDMGFFPSKAEPDIWMRDKGDHYEHLACYVDDLLIGSRDPQAIVAQLESSPHSFKLKRTGPMEYHLGCDYFRDEDGTLCAGPRKYIQHMMDQYKAVFGEKPRRSYKSPLDADDHPELDTSPMLDDDGITKYQSIIGTLQWAITLGRFDIAVAVATMSSFSAAPREEHINYLKRIVGYLAGMKDACIRIWTHKPDFSALPEVNYDWTRSVYGNVEYTDPPDAPEP
jgi:Reverse transcriptase (RNA-dependent DNA polymerase)